MIRINNVVGSDCKSIKEYLCIVLLTELETDFIIPKNAVPFDATFAPALLSFAVGFETFAATEVVETLYKKKIFFH